MNKWVRALLIVFFLGVIGYCLSQLLPIYIGYIQGNEIYSDIKESVRETVARSTGSTETETEETEAPTVVYESLGTMVTRQRDWGDYSAYRQETEMNIVGVGLSYLLAPKYVFDFDALLALNPDVRGWIIVPDTKIDYPIVQSENNEEYIRKAADGTANNAGSIFIDYREAATGLSSRNVILYGHNQNSGYMFHDLIQFKDEEFAMGHRNFYVYNLEGKRCLYETIAFFVTTSTSKVYDVSFSSDEEYMDYINMLLSLSEYDFGVDLTAADRIMVLSTCTNEVEDERYVLIGRYLYEE